MRAKTKTHSRYDTKDKILITIGSLFVLYAIGTAIYAPLKAVDTAPELYKTSVQNSNTFVMHTFNIWDATIPLDAIFLGIAVVLGMVGSLMIVSAVGFGDYSTVFGLPAFFLSLILILFPYYFTLHYVNSTQQTHVTQEFANWLKTDHNIILNTPEARNPLNIAAKPALLQDTQGNPTIVTFKVDGNTITFQKATPK